MERTRHAARAAGGKGGGAPRAPRARAPSPVPTAATRLAGLPPPGPASPASQAVARTLARLAEAIAVAMAAVRRGSAEGVHDLRTASRRVRAALAAHRDEVPDAARRELRRAVSALRRSAGAVRDLDVLRETIDGVRFPPRDAAGAAALRAALAARRRQERRGLASALASPRLAGIPARMGRLAVEALARPSAPLGLVASSRLPSSMEGALTRLAALPRPLATAPPEALHGFRIAVRRARYAADAFSPAFGRPAERFLEALTSLQDALGGIQDAHAIGASLGPLVAATGARGSTRAAADRAARAVADALASRAVAHRERLAPLVDAAFGKSALRDLHAHLAKRAAAAAAGIRG